MSEERDRLRARIAALLAKTVANGCTEAEALSAAAKVAELLDRHAVSMDEVALRASPFVEARWRSRHRKRVPLDEALGAVADFFDCRLWREKGADGAPTHVFFGLGEDAAAARDLAGLIDDAVRAELGRYKTGPDYARFDTRDRHTVNASFALGMVSGIAGKLDALRAEREARRRGSGRDLAPAKASGIEAALRERGLVVVEGQGGGPRRPVAEGAYDAGEAAGGALRVL